MREIEVKISSGLHTRPAGRLASLVAEHNVTCFLHYNHQKINAASILDIISAMIPYGAKVELEVDEESADIFFQKVTELLTYAL